MISAVLTLALLFPLAVSYTPNSPPRLLTRSAFFTATTSASASAVAAAVLTGSPQKAGAFSVKLPSGPSPTDVASGRSLPPAVASLARIRKAAKDLPTLSKAVLNTITEATKELGEDGLVNMGMTSQQWSSLSLDLRPLYNINRDMTTVAATFTPEKKTAAEGLGETLKKALKAADVPARKETHGKEDVEEYVKQLDIAGGVLVDFLDLLSDVPDL